jgi:hypothetical protein
VSSGPERAAGFEKEAMPQVVTAAAVPAFDITRLKEEVAPETVPLAIPEVEETEQVIIPPITDVESRGASPSLFEELCKLRE